MKNAEIEEKLSEINKLKTSVAIAQNELEKLIANKVAKTHPHIGLYATHCPFMWNCEKSPFGYCVYDTAKDPAWDTCLYCGEPYERK